MSDHVLILREALVFIASKSACAAWVPAPMGGGGSSEWRGCASYRSADPEEWCLCCTAMAALLAAKAKSDPSSVSADKNCVSNRRRKQS